jgi:hypothetical protein
MSIKFIVVNHTFYDSHTDPEVIRILESARLNDKRVRIFLGDPDTGFDWCEEHDVTGYIGRSCGPVRSPILLHNARSTGGGVILTECIVKIMVAGCIAWQHPKYHIGAFFVHGTTVLRDCEVFARFDFPNQAYRYLQFITGKRMTR